MFGTVEVVKEFIHARKRVAVLDGDSIDGTVIDTKAEGAIGLASEKDGAPNSDTLGRIQPFSR